MKKIFNLMMGFLVLGLAGFALAETASGGTGGSSDVVVTSTAQGGDAEPTLLDSGSGSGNAVASDTGNKGEDSELQNRVQERVTSGNYENSEGKQMQIQESGNDRIELKVGDSKASSGLKINSETVEGKTVLRTQLSNGMNAEIKVMPDSASETALERLRLKTCSEEAGCSIELKEVGEGENAKLAYEVKTQRTSRIFGMFEKTMNVEAQVDAENGEVIQSKKPWWAILASEPVE